MQLEILAPFFGAQQQRSQPLFVRSFQREVSKRLHAFVEIALLLNAPVVFALLKSMIFTSHKAELYRNSIQYKRGNYREKRMIIHNDDGDGLWTSKALTRITFFPLRLT